MLFARNFHRLVFTWKSFKNRMKFRMKFMPVSFRLFLMRKFCMKFMYAFWWMLKSWYIRRKVTISNLLNMSLVFFSSFLILLLRKFCKALEIKIFVSVFCLCVYVFFRKGGSWFVFVFFLFVCLLFVIILYFIIFEGEERFGITVIYNTN